MKYIEVYTFSDGETSSDIYYDREKALDAQKTSKNNCDMMVESVVILLDKDGYSETISRWRKEVENGE